MNHTTNYQLNQWELHDRVMMQDFNSDNAKIDAALHELDTAVDAKADKSALTTLQNTVAEVSARAGSDLLASTTLAQSTSSVFMNLSQVDWSKYSIVLSIMVPVLSSGATYSELYGARTNKPSVEVLFPMRSAASPVIGFCVHHTSDFPDIIQSTTFQTFGGFNYSVQGGTFEPGTKAVVIGIH